MKYINLNGKITPVENAQIPVDNGAFRYGYGLFETMLVRDGVLNLGGYHWERLFAGLDVVRIERPGLMTREWLEEQALMTVKKNGMDKLCRVRMQFYAGGGGLYGRNESHPGMIIECFSLIPETIMLNENGLVAGLATGIRKSTDTLANLKSCSALVYAIAARQAMANKWNDAFICNCAGNIIESTIANIFWIKNGTVFTPPLADGCVAGVMRRFIMEQITVTEKSLGADELDEADEVFLSNAIKRIKWVSSVDGKKYGNAMIKSIYTQCFP